MPADLKLAIAFTDIEDGCNGDEAKYDPEGPATCGTHGELSKKLKVKIARDNTTTALYDNW